VTPNESAKYPKHYASKFRVYRGANYNFVAPASVIVPFDTVDFDVLNEFDEAVTYTFTPNEAGFYLLSAFVEIIAFPVGAVAQLFIVDETVGPTRSLTTFENQSNLAHRQTLTTTVIAQILAGNIYSVRFNCTANVVLRGLMDYNGFSMVRVG